MAAYVALLFEGKENVNESSLSDESASLKFISPFVIKYYGVKNIIKMIMNINL